MRALTLVSVAVVAMLVGCGPVEEHQFARAPDAAAAASVETTPVAFDAQHGVPADALASHLVEQVEICSGSCNASTCSCTGSYECCSAGCNKCWSDHFPD